MSPLSPAFFVFSTWGFIYNTFWRIIFKVSFPCNFCILTILLTHQQIARIQYITCIMIIIITLIINTLLHALASIGYLQGEICT